MGWTNYIIIPKNKLVIEISRYVEDIEDYRRNALEDAIANEDSELDEMDQVKLTEVTLKDLTILYTAYDRMQRIAGMEYDKLLLFWLEHRDIDYEIKSEHQIDIKEYEQKGYTIIRIFQNKDEVSDLPETCHEEKKVLEAED